MTKGENWNHPPKGSTIRVDPIKSLEDIKKIKDYLKKSPRNLALFTMGINTNLRASDLVRIKAGLIREFRPMDIMTIREKKTGKVRRISLNKACIDSVSAYLESEDVPDELPIFRLTVPSVNRLVKKWCDWVGLEGNFGAHTLRKTFCFHQYFTFETPLAVIMRLMNHSSERQTLDYINVTPEMEVNAYANEI